MSGREDVRRRDKESGMTDKIVGAPGCNRSELKLVKRASGAASVRPAPAPARKG